jgi:hypothetical protein
MSILNRGDTIGAIISCSMCFKLVVAQTARDLSPNSQSPAPARGLLFLGGTLIGPFTAD